MKIDKEKVSTIIKKLTFEFPYSVDDWMDNLYFENYHSHKDFSNCLTRADSPTPIEEYVPRIKELKSKCLYSLDHGCQGNWFHVYDVAEKNGLKYRHSAEVYWVKDRHEQDKANCHMCIIAKNREGLEDLNYILSMANIDGYYYKPRIDLELLLSVSPNNFIVTSACVAGWRYQDADEIWLKIAAHFKDNFFLEVQNHNTDSQKKLNKKILALSRKYGIPIICGLDSHYIYPEDSIRRDQILKYKKIFYPDEEGWYLDYPDAKEIIKRFEEQGVLSDKEILECMLNTNVFVSGCEDIKLDRGFKIPTIYQDLSKNERISLYKKLLNEAYKKDKFKSKAKADGIRWEAKQVIDSDTVDYFLTTKGIIDLAVNKYHGILTTTSRGSNASFVTNKLLGSTTIDRFLSEIPIYPERFLTKERVLAGQMPDQDLNIAAQEPFVSASKELLGEHGCYPLMAIEVLKEKNAWKLFAGANDVTPEQANIISKFIDEYNKAIKHADGEEKESIKLENYIPNEYYDLFMQSKDYHNIVMNLKVHPCGHLIFNGDIRREIGLISAISESSGERHVVACVEGKYLDEFGYVKEDFLIVDSVSLTHEFFESISKEVPSFERLKEMIKDDQAVWDIYAKGITCCVNQCEKKKTTDKVMIYKPQSIAELSGFIAGIRPGFASLINTYLSRKEYSTGEKVIDDLLEESSHFALYQESLMKVLSFLGLPMGETYGIIKSISKKKLKGKMKDDLLKKLKKEWINKFGNLDNFNNIWKIIEDSASYAFNAPHAYSMAGDSLYQAWFKAHYTAKFYEVAIKHYQKKNNKDKINALMDEANKYYGFKRGEYKFRNDNRTVHVDEESHAIYLNLSAIKGFGENVARELYDMKDAECKTFPSLLKLLKNTTINKTQLEALIKMNYFSEYGNVETLLAQYDIFKKYYGKKQFKKKGIEDDSVIRMFCTSETEKTFRMDDIMPLIEYLCSRIKIEPCFYNKLRYEKELLGYITSVNKEESKRNYFVLDVNNNKTVTRISLYEIFSGKTREVKMWSSRFNQLPIKCYDVMVIKSLIKQNKRKASDEINPVNGKKIWVDIPNKYEYWVKEFSIKNY